MDYDTTLEHLYRLERFGIKLGLDNIRRLLSLLGDPHHGLKVLHVTGTNGKGSVCAHAASVLEEAGYRVGLYTSPHLVRFNERIQVNRTPITDDDVLRLWSGMQPAIRAMTAARAIDHPTFFEVTTAMA
ncbi:MAG: bifunctional folylpolyglutamate synthase/dihydrofolate synthase, partial [Methanobacteriota archaeon]